MIRFTLEQANRALILIRPIMSDILYNMEKVNRLYTEIKQDRSNQYMDESDILAKVEDAQKHITKIEHHIKELEKIGVKVKDINLGVIDFPSTINSNKNTPVSLCWKFGESGVTYWHNPEENFRGRRPIANSTLTQNIC